VGGAIAAIEGICQTVRVLLQHHRSPIADDGRLDPSFEGHAGGEVE